MTDRRRQRVTRIHPQLASVSEDHPHHARHQLFVGAPVTRRGTFDLRRRILEQRPFLWTMELRFFGGVGGMLLFVTLRGNWAHIMANYRRQQPWGTITLSSFLGAYLALILWLGGYKLIPASVAAILNQTNAAFIVLLAWLMLGEAISQRKITGLALTLAGVIIMLLV